MRQISPSMVRTSGDDPLWSISYIYSYTHTHTVIRLPHQVVTPSVPSHIYAYPCTHTHIVVRLPHQSPGKQCTIQRFDDRGAHQKRRTQRDKQRRRARTRTHSETTARGRG